MKLIDEKGRIFGLINYVDLIVVLIVVVVGAKFLVLDKINDGIEVVNSNQQIEFEYEVSGVRQISIDNVSIGDVFKDAETKSVLGEVTGKRFENAKMATTDAEGNVVYSEIPDKYNMVITIRGNGVTSDSEIKVGNTRLQIGKLIIIESKMNRFMGVVVGL